MAEQIPASRLDKEDPVIDAPEATTTNVTSHGHDIYELHALDMVQSEPQKPRSKLRLVAILIALDVSSGCAMFISWFRLWTNMAFYPSCRFSLLLLIKPSLLLPFLL